MPFCFFDIHKLNHYVHSQAWYLIEIQRRIMTKTDFMR